MTSPVQEYAVLDHRADASQQQVLRRAEETDRGPLLVYGGPGAGKSVLAVELALRFLREGHDSRRLLILSPTRSTSALLRDAVESRWAEISPGASLSEQPSRSFASYAFWILGEARRRQILDFPARQPRLLSGAEQDRILREILESLQQEAAGESWPAELREAAETDGFRKEIRELLDRATEYGVSPERLSELAEECARPEWRTAADIYERYLNQLDAESHADAFDPAGLINEACHILEFNPSFLEEERQRLGCVIVDDLQEASPTVYRLLRLIGAGRPVVAFANPDAVTQGFRGARPDKLGNWAAPVRRTVPEEGEPLNPELDSAVLLEDGTEVVRRSGSGSMVPDVQGGLPGQTPEILALLEDHRASGAVGSIYARTIRRIAPGKSAAAREPWVEVLKEHSREDGSPAPRTQVDAVVVPSDYQAEQFILQEVLERHDRYGVPLGEIAVIVRNGTLAQRIARVLQAQGVPIRQQMSEVILHEEAAVEPLLEVLHWATVSAAELPGASAAAAEPVPEEESDAGVGNSGAACETAADQTAERGGGGAPSLTMDLPQVLRLLTSRYGTADSLTLRRIRQVLLRAERQRIVLVQRSGERQVSDQQDQDGAQTRDQIRGQAQPPQPRSSDELITAAANDPQDPTFLAAAEEAPGLLSGLRRISRMLEAAALAVKQNPQGVGAEEILWAVWSAAGLSETWAELTRQAGLEGRRADRDLDAVMALFQAAERFVDQNPGAPAAAFVDHMERLELPMDTLAETSSAEDAVEILTPATAAGREFDTVILSGLQDGVWPNLQPRGELLGSNHLVDVIEQRAGRESTSSLVKRMQVLQDEYRLFATAVSRSAARLFAVAVENSEDSPSMFLDLVVPADQRQDRAAAIPRPVTAPRLIAELRRFLEDSHRQELEEGAPYAEEHHAQTERSNAARALATLARHGLTGADPDQWWGLHEISSSGPLLEPEEEVRVSPSKVQTAVDSPLQWFTQTVGGVEPTDFSRMLGTLIHEIAEDHPQEMNPEKLQAVLAERWHELGLPEGWEAEADRQRAETMVEKLTLYHASVVDEKRRVLARELDVEATLELPVEGEDRTVRIRGTIDRVERTEDGRFYVVDLKTGRAKPSSDQVPRHGQLGTYQLLVSLGALEPALQQAHIDVEGVHGSAGAALLHVGTTVKKNDIQEQAPAEAETDWPRQQITHAAQVMTGASFEVRHQSTQDECQAGVLCPLCAGTKQVTQP